MFKRWFGSSSKKGNKDAHQETRSQQRPYSHQQPYDASSRAMIQTSSSALKDGKDPARLKKTMTLPRNFAQSVIELEIYIERPDVSKEHVKKLMDLYTVSLSLTTCAERH